MWKTFKALFAVKTTLRGAAITTGPYKNVTAEAARAENVSGVIYPPRDPGLPIQTAQSLLHDQHEILSMLRIHAASGARFDTRFEGPISRAADYANVLPGSSTSSFSGAGGLFRAALEMAFVTFRASDGRIFTGAMGVEDRHKLESRWRYVCFAVGLLYPIGGALARMSVLDEKGKKWAPELESLSEWANLSCATRLYVSWLSQEAGMGPSAVVGTFALKIIGRDNVEWLNEGSPELVKALVDIVSGGVASKDLIAASLVKEMWTAVNARELSRVHQNYGSLTIGSNVAPYVFDAMVGLAKSTWKINETVMFADKTGLYLEWPQAGRDIIDYCKRMGFQGIPANESALLGILTATKLIDRGVDGMGLVEIADSIGEVKAAIKVAQPAMLLPDDVSLESFASSRPVHMNAVMAMDPLRTRSPKEKALAKPQRPAPVLAQLDIDDVVATEPPDDVAVEPSSIEESPRLGDAEIVQQQNAASVTSSAPTPPVATATPSNPVTHAKAAKSDTQKGAIVEGGEVRYSDLLPSDLTQKLRPHESEILGKLVHAWRTKAMDGKMMRMCENGAAFEFSCLAGLMRDPPSFLSSMGELGMLYTAAASPSKSVYKVPISEGGQSAVTCFILNHTACRRLALS